MDRILTKLALSKFRSSFKLGSKELDYVKKKGLGVIEEHARDFVRKRLAPAEIINDGKQTPMRGHPVFVAQHATATCCRNCLFKWHHIKPGYVLTDREINYIVRLIMLWITQQMNESDRK